MNIFPSELLKMLQENTLPPAEEYCLIVRVDSEEENKIETVDQILRHPNCPAGLVLKALSAGYEYPGNLNDAVNQRFFRQLGQVLSQVLCDQQGPRGLSLSWNWGWCDQKSTSLELHLKEALELGTCPEGMIIDLTATSYVNLKPLAEALNHGKAPTGLKIKLRNNQDCDELLQVLSAGQCPPGFSVIGGKLGQEGLQYLIRALKEGNCPSLLTLHLEGAEGISAEQLIELHDALTGEQVPDGFEFNFSLVGTNDLAKAISEIMLHRNARPAWLPSRLVLSDELSSQAMDSLAAFLKSDYCPESFALIIPTDLKLDELEKLIACVSEGSIPAGFSICLKRGFGDDQGNLIANRLFEALKKGNCPPNLTVDVSASRIAPRTFYFPDEIRPESGIQVLAEAIKSGNFPKNLTIILDNTPWEDSDLELFKEAIASDGCPLGLKIIFKDGHRDSKQDEINQYLKKNDEKYLVWAAMTLVLSRQQGDLKMFPLDVINLFVAALIPPELADRTQAIRQNMMQDSLGTEQRFNPSRLLRHLGKSDLTKMVSPILVVKINGDIVQMDALKKVLTHPNCPENLRLVLEPATVSTLQDFLNMKTILEDALCSAKVKKGLTVISSHWNDTYSSLWLVVEGVLLKGGVFPEGFSVIHNGDLISNHVIMSLRSPQCSKGFSLTGQLKNDSVSLLVRVLTGGQCPEGLTLTFKRDKLSEKSIASLSEVLAHPSCPVGLKIFLYDEENSPTPLLPKAKPTIEEVSFSHAQDDSTQVEPTVIKSKEPEHAKANTTPQEIMKRVKSYYSYATASKGRYHFYSATQSGSNLTGDLLKTQILTDFLIRLDQCKTLDELRTTVSELKLSAQYKTLAKAQGIFTAITKGKTSSVKAFEKMVLDKAASLSPSNKMSKKI